MAQTNKRYYWIQLAQDFFKSKEMKLLRKVPGGDTHTIIYLKLMLISLEDGGKIYFDGLAQDLAEEMSLLIDEDTEAVRMTLMFLSKKGLLTQRDNYEFFLEQVPEMTGSETASTRRSRKHREQKALQCNTNATKCNGDIDIEKELKKDIELELELETEESFVDVVEANLGRSLVKFEHEMIDDYLVNKHISKELFLEAVKIAVANNILKFNYIAGVLDNWIKDGIKTVEQVYQAQLDFKAKKSNKSAKSNVPEWVDKDYRHEATAEEQAQLEELKASMLENEKGS